MIDVIIDYNNVFAPIVAAAEERAVCTCVVGIFSYSRICFSSENADDKTRKEYSKALQALQNLPEADFVRLLKNWKMKIKLIREITDLSSVGSLYQRQIFL